MKLDAKLAQSIVNKMMNEIPYNINMMDDHGYIIASGDPTRINTLHLGALDAITRGKALPLEQSYGEHGQPGVNMPVFYKSKIVGVIGITGDPKQVTPLASLLRTSTELLLNQSEMDLIAKKEESRLNRFLYQWIQVTSDIEHKTNLRLESEQLNIDIFEPRYAIAIHSNKLNTHFIPIDPKDYLVSVFSTVTVILTQELSSIKRIKTFCIDHKLTIGIGNLTKNIGTSVNEALETIQIAKMLNKSDLTSYSQVHFVSTLISGNLDIDDILNKFKNFSEKSNGEELIETINEYIQNDTNVVQTSEKMHIHRNTLNYRLNRINAEFGLNPRNTIDLFKLYVGYIYFCNDQFTNNPTLELN